MKKLLLYTLLLAVASITCLTTTNAQTMPPVSVKDYAFAYPVNPTPTDSIFVAYSYLSSDACPDYYLTKDSVVNNKIYVSKKKVIQSGVCAQVISNLVAFLNLGLLKENAQIYYEGTLIKTVSYGCNMDRKGEVVAGTGDCSGELYIKEITIYLSAIPRLWGIPKATGIYTNGSSPLLLKAGDKVNFGGSEIKNDSNTFSPCRIVGVANCYEVTSTPPVCVMDKSGIVTEFKNNSSLVKDSLTGEIYAINNIKLEIGTKIKFKGTKIECITSPCYNIIDCYAVIATPPPACVKNKKGQVISCLGKLLIQEYSPISSSRQLYVIQDSNAIINSSGTTEAVTLKEGDQVLFGGYLTKNDSSATAVCRTVGVATCYEVISTPPPCVMDKVGIVTEFKDNSTILKDSLTGDIYAINNIKLAAGTYIKFKGTKIVCVKAPCYNIVDCYTIISTPPVGCVKDKTGVVVAGIDGCSGQLFIEETTPYMSPVRRLYSIDYMVEPNSMPIRIGLKVGDKVKFGGYLTPNDSNKVSLCYTIGVATCYEIVTPTACVMDKSGVVVPGIDGCTGKLFIQDTSSPDSSIQLYAIKQMDTATNSTNPAGLKAGDKVKFGGYLTKNDSTLDILCPPIVGIATCYELIPSENTYTLSGSVRVGTELMKSGLAILYKKGYFKATASYTITDSTFIFTNLPKADYTVYVIPDITLYKNYLPTFYINKLLYKKADYLTLDRNVSDLVVNLKQFVLPKGTGKIFGNIFFESYNLKDSILIYNGLQKASNAPMNNLAINTPVMLFNSNSEPIAWTTTDEYGNYTFENIPFDFYKVVSQTASAEGESAVNLTSGNSTANADVLLKSSQTQTDIVNPGDVVLNVYPNPVVDKLTITLAVSEKIDIYGVMGELLIHQNLTAGDNTIDLSSVNKGVYFAKVGKATIKVIKR